MGFEAELVGDEAEFEAARKLLPVKV